MSTTPTTRAEARRLRAARVLRPAFRRWAYGVSVAAVGVAIFLRWLPVEASPVVLPLLMALFYVDNNGEPKANPDTTTE